MEQSLNREQLEELMRASQQGRTEEPERKHSHVPVRCDFRHAAKITANQARSVSMLHERFAARVSNALGAYLRVGLEMNLASVEQVIYNERLRRLPEMTYLASISIRPLNVDALLQLDLSLAFPMIDLVLGGEGKGEVEVRPITEIEEQILESVVRLLCRQLQESWQPVLELEIQFDRRQMSAQAQGMILSTEKVMSLGFEIRMPEASGTLNLIFPATVSNALLRKLAVQWTYARAVPNNAVRERLWLRLLKSWVPVELRVPPVPVPISALLGLQAGSVLALPHRVADPVRLAVRGRDLFLAKPVSCGAQRGARLDEQLPFEGSTRE
jgi:flagellar motor switch protein FliM